MPAKKICLLAVIALTITTVIVCARPFWCPDLTNDNFINFPDFAVQANYWRQTGSGLPGDFWFNNAVDINDVAYLVLWWLQDCFDPPAVFCPNCIYPDCNVMNCDAPTYPVLCPSCVTTPPFIKVKIEGIQNCPCQGDYSGIYHEDGEPWYLCDCELPNFSRYFTGSLDGNYILPYEGYDGSICKWSGFFDINDMNIIVYFNDASCCNGNPWLDPKRYKWITITVQKVFNPEPPARWEIMIDVSLWGGHGFPEYPIWYLLLGKTDEILNCVECIAQDPLSCSDPMAPPGYNIIGEPYQCCCYGDENEQWILPTADGTATITIPP